MIQGRSANPLPSLTAKICTKCGRQAPLDEFYADARGILGRTSACNRCIAAANNCRALRYSRQRNARPTHAACAACGVIRPRADFPPNKYSRRGIQSYCRPCRRQKQKWWGLKAGYGISRAEFDAIMARQKGCCAICLAELSCGRETHVDHCHRTGRVRGLLCEACNLGLGKFSDNPEALERAAEYLRRSS